MRQYDPGPGVSISSLAYDYPPSWRVPEHEHESDQLIYAVSGVMEVVIGQTLWLIPPQFAVWIAAHVRLMKAVELLASRRRIKEVAFAVGYRQASTFVATFRRSFGLTPKAWISNLQSEHGDGGTPPRSQHTPAVPPARASEARRRRPPQPRVNARTAGESRRS
jgi:Helix-turn-helix domain